jgi:hypothetical protein
MKHIRFCQNNLLQLPTTVLTASSALANFPVSNAVDSYRYRAWMTGGHFAITAANQNVHINTGGDLTAVVPIGSYATGAALALAIQTALNAVSTNWICVYVPASGLFVFFRIVGPATLRLTITTNAIWDTIGFTSGVDTAANPGFAVGNVRRNHTSEKVLFDLGTAQEVRAFFAIGAAAQYFKISSTAVQTLKANNIPSMVGAPISISITAEDQGNFRFLETEDFANTTYRYWEWEFQDRENPNGPNFPVNQIYLGRFISPVFTNLHLGLVREIIDDSREFKSSGGSKFWRRVPRYWRYSSTSVEYLIDSDRTELERVFSEIGTTTPIFISYDPDASISATVGEFTKYMRVDSASVSHQLYKYFNIDFSADELI